MNWSFEVMRRKHHTWSEWSCGPYTITTGLCDPSAKPQYDILFKGRWVEGSTVDTLEEAKDLVEAHQLDAQ